jgi:hypothetical protein
LNSKLIPVLKNGVVWLIAGILNMRGSSREFENSLYLAEKDVKHILLKCSGTKNRGRNLCIVNGSV